MYPSVSGLMVVLIIGIVTAANADVVRTELVMDRIDSNRGCRGLCRPTPIRRGDV